DSAGRGSANAGERRARSTYTRPEVCAICSFTPEQLAELESFGVVDQRGEGATFNERELAVLRAAAEFLARGVEARHLRAWRQAAERETGLFEQRMMPLLRQRNPQARQEALTLLE